jgi:hypothetical protein
MAENKEILELLATGKISSEEAAAMLNNPEGTADPTPAPAAKPAPKPAPASAAAVETSGSPSWFRVRVTNMKTGENKVSVNIPIRMLKLGLKIGGRFAPELKDLDWHELDGLMQDLQTGLLVEVQDEESNEHVRVFIE